MKLRYPVDRTMHALRSYDLFVTCPGLVDELVLPMIKAEVEYFFSTAWEYDRLVAHQFIAALDEEWRRVLAQRTMIVVQDLKARIDGDQTIKLSWTLRFDSSAHSLEINPSWCRSDADIHLQQARAKLDAALKLIRS